MFFDSSSATIALESGAMARPDIFVVPSVLQAARPSVAASAAVISAVRKNGRRIKRENSPAAILSPYLVIVIAKMWHLQGRPA
jgi:hypothetical protein